MANKKITSHQMIFNLADVCGVSYETVKKVIVVPRKMVNVVVV